MMLVPGVKWNREGAASFPLEGPFRRAFVPHRRRAAAGGDGDNFLVQLALRFHALSRRELGDVGVGHHLVGEHANRALAIFALPISELFRAHVFDERAADDRHAFRLDPLFVGTVFVHHELDVGMNFEFFHGSGHSELPPCEIQFEVSARPE